mmetsp:Transcript_46636/g.106971  ORF Transcript_46636/g.106971 Transcript_46636/m.106971 type:complete len:409 (+) Transcript_46636:288-1514(+)
MDHALPTTCSSGQASGTARTSAPSFSRMPRPTRRARSAAITWPQPRRRDQSNGAAALSHRHRAVDHRGARRRRLRVDAFQLVNINRRVGRRLGGGAGRLAYHTPAVVVDKALHREHQPLPQLEQLLGVRRSEKEHEQRRERATQEDDPLAREDGAVPDDWPEEEDEQRHLHRPRPAEMCCGEGGGGGGVEQPHGGREDDRHQELPSGRDVVAADLDTRREHRLLRLAVRHGAGDDRQRQAEDTHRQEARHVHHQQHHTPAKQQPRLGERGRAQHFDHLVVAQPKGLEARVVFVAHRAYPTHFVGVLPLGPVGKHALVIHTEAPGKLHLLRESELAVGGGLGESPQCPEELESVVVRRGDGERFECVLDHRHQPRGGVVLVDGVVRHQLRWHLERLADVHKDPRAEAMA